MTRGFGYEDCLQLARFYHTLENTNFNRNEARVDNKNILPEL